jgi:hypothetical protein
VGKNIRTEKNMQVHCDSGAFGRENIMTFVCTFRVGCERGDGANLRFAGSAAGVFDFNERNGIDYSPADNSMYCFPGSYVFHKVGALTRGTRISIVLFLRWKDIIPAQIVMYWTGKDFVCDCCLHTFAIKKTRDAHQKRNKKGECVNSMYVIMK